MNHGCNTVFEPERAAFALPAGLDCLPPRIDFADLESRRLDDSLDALDVLGLSAPVLALNAADAMLFVEPAVCTPPPSSSSSSSSSNNNSSSRATSRGRPKCSGARDTASPRAHNHHPKKASRKQVHELQAMVNAMQVQVDGAATEIAQLAQLVGRFAHQREHEHERVRRRVVEQQQQLFEESEMDMDLGAQQRHLQAQVKHEREQFVREQQQRRQQVCFEGQSPPSPIRF